MEVIPTNWQGLSLTSPPPTLELWGRWQRAVKVAHLAQALPGRPPTASRPH